MSDEFPIMDNSNLAQFLLAPGNVPKQIVAEFWPFIDEKMAGSNLSENNILDIEDLLFIHNIQVRSGMTRLQKQKNSNSLGTRVRAYNKASTSLAKNGFGVKRVTGSYRHVSMDSGEGQKRGLVGRVLNRS